MATGHPYIPQIAGGAQSSTDELTNEFIRRGHTVAVASGLSGEGWLAFNYRVRRRLQRRKSICDHGLGYPVYRAWFIWDALDEVIGEFRPDVVLVQSGFPVRLAARCQELGVPTVIYQRNVEEDDLGGDLRALKDVPFIANSHFTAEWLKATCGVDATVVYPLLQRAKYETQTQGQNVTFINPHPHKGSAIALDIAEACPDIPFVFVEGWMLSQKTRQNLLDRLEKLPNVTLKPRTHRMADIYRDARIVLAPSTWEEAFGRIAAEAHFSGIPVIASRRGGLPEAVGPGGILVDITAPISEWVAAVRSLWSDETRWREVSEAAYQHGKRDALKPDDQIRKIIGILQRTVGGSQNARNWENPTTAAV